MVNIIQWLSEKSSVDYRKAVSEELNKAVNIMEFDGELWISSFGEPIVPLILLKEGEIGGIMERCRKGWSKYKIENQRK